MSKNLELSGGWDASFASQNGAATVDGQSARLGVLVDAVATASIDHFVIQNGTSGIANYGDLTARYVVVQNNHGVGIDNYGPMLIQWSTVQGDQYSASDKGGGIYNSQYGGNLVILNSTIRNNQSGAGAGILNNGDMTVVNATISDNTNTFCCSNSGGGGVHNFLGTLALKNVTISDNEGAQFGGGIYSSREDRVTLSNTIVANNTAADCSGPVDSAGYNILGNSTAARLAPQPAISSMSTPGSVHCRITAVPPSPAGYMPAARQSMLATRQAAPII